ncbi:MAG: hypothetical protein II610_09105 [Treponema sp.]|nr:hypothetical protein [Treponema sp.]
MVLKLIFTIALLVAVAIFSGFNLDNRCNIWLFGKVFTNAPIFMSILVSFAAGIVVTLPAVFLRGEKKMTAEQARALAERLEQNEKKSLEKQIARRQKLEEAKAKAQGVLAKKPAFEKKEKDVKNNSQATEAAAPQENK